jgi:hypothetical protein
MASYKDAAAAAVEEAYEFIFNEIVGLLKAEPPAFNGGVFMRFDQTIHDKGTRDAVVTRLKNDLARRCGVHASVAETGDIVVVSIRMKKNPFWFDPGTEGFMGGRVMRREGRWWIEMRMPPNIVVTNNGDDAAAIEVGKTYLRVDARDNIIGARRNPARV